MLCKIAARNVRKSISDYAVYFLTLTFAIMIFYAFNSMDSQQAMLDLGSSKKVYMEGLIDSISVLSVFVSLIMAFLIIYANNFLIKRRHKELGIYMILGMGKGRVSGIFVTETLIVGALSLVSGIALGILFSQGMSIFTANMFEVTMDKYAFVFSFEALIKTLLYFGIIFVCVMIFNVINVSNKKIIKLLQADKQNEQIKIKHPVLSIVLLALGILLCVMAYWLVLTFTLLGPLTPVAIVLGVAGTLLLFAGLSGVAVRFFAKNKKRYYKGLNLFVSRQLTSKINTTHTSLAFICLMIFFTAVILIGGTSIGASFNKQVSSTIAYDAEIQLKDTKEQGLQTDVVETMGIGDYVEKSVRADLYETGVHTGDVFGKYLGNEQFGVGIEVMGITQFNENMKTMGMSPITLQDNEVAVLSSSENFSEILQNYVNDGNHIKLGDKEFEVFMEAGFDKETDFLIFQKSMQIFVLNDSQLKDFPYDMSLIEMKYAGYKKTAEQAIMQKVDEYKTSGAVPSIRISTLQEAFDMGVSLQAVTAFIGIYLGIVFMMAAAAVLALQQLSAAADNKKRYAILSKLGTDDKMMNRSILKQIGFYFLIPLIIAMIHAAVGIKACYDTMKAFGNTNITGDVLITLCIIGVIYGAYFIATYLSSKKIIKEK
ncbi:MAG: ABC transporter permease [Christensenellaceae bacterium]